MSIAEEGALVKPLAAEMWERYDTILSSPPGSIAIIKLRVLADPDIGMDESQEAKSDAPVLAFLETHAGAGGSPWA